MNIFPNNPNGFKERNSFLFLHLPSNLNHAVKNYCFISAVPKVELF